MTSPSVGLDDRGAAAAEHLRRRAARRREVVGEGATRGCTAARRRRRRRTRSRCAACSPASRRCRRRSGRPRSGGRRGRPRSGRAASGSPSRSGRRCGPSGVSIDAEVVRRRRSRGRAARAWVGISLRCFGSSALGADQEQRVVERPRALGLALVDADRAVDAVLRAGRDELVDERARDVDRVRPEPLPELVEARRTRPPPCAQAFGRVERDEGLRAGRPARRRRRRPRRSAGRLLDASPRRRGSRESPEPRRLGRSGTRSCGEHTPAGPTWPYLHLPRHDRGREARLLDRRRRRAARCATDVLDRVCAQVAELHRRRRERRAGHLGRDRARHAGARARPAAHGDRRAAGGLGGRAGQPLPGLRGAARRTGTCARRRSCSRRPTSSSARNYLNARQTLRRLLDWRVVPVVNENDTTATDEITFGDNDFLAAQVAIMLEARLLVLLTDQTGLYTKDPRQPPRRRAGRRRSTERVAARRLRDRRAHLAVRLGGMRSKVAAAGMAGASGIGAVICDGTADGTLLAAASAASAVGTRFSAASGARLELQALAPLREAEPRDAAGRRRRGSGAARERQQPAAGRDHRGRGRVRGRRRGRGGLPTAGRSARGSSTTRPASSAGSRALRTDKVRELLPHASEEAVHRDYFVLT